MQSCADPNGRYREPNLLRFKKRTVSIDPRCSSSVTPAMDRMLKHLLSHHDSHCVVEYVNVRNDSHEAKAFFKNDDGF